jgi:phosphoglycolate phosphatase-like HAD superfamily hydrolase
VRDVAGVVFDMDGTLVDSLGVALECYRRVVLEFGWPDRTHDEILAAFPVGPARESVRSPHRAREIRPPDGVASVGDGPSDVATARACGALAIGARWGQQHDPARGAELFAAPPTDLVRMLLPRATVPAEP